MIYLAVLLILCGLLILITALYVERGNVSPTGVLKSGGIDKPADYRSGDLEPEDVEIIFPGDMIDEQTDDIYQNDTFISFDDEIDDSAEFEHPYVPEYRDSDDTEYNLNHNNVRPAGNERISTDLSERAVIEEREKVSSSRRQDNGFVSAIMFDDRSNIIDYESGVGVIDSTLAKYKSIKRIGKGRIESDYDGVNFYLDERLYRFDFHKVYDIWSGSNFIALPLKGNSTVKLFIIENSAGFPEKVEADFKEYEKGL